MHDSVSSTSSARGLRLAIVTSQYHSDITESMRNAAIAEFADRGGIMTDLHQFQAPGTFELTAICNALAHQMRRTGHAIFNAVIALGCVITGETTHDRYIAQSVTQGLTAITIQTGVPIAFGVLTCQTIEQARARSLHAKRENNKGAQAMIAAIEAANTIKSIQTTQGLR